jgi:hypothetical protein
MVIGTDTRDSCGKCELRETPQEQSDEEAPEPPAESERLERKSTGKINRAKRIKVVECSYFLLYAARIMIRV